MITYSIFDPTGNITALVASAVEVSRQPEVAMAVMARHPEVEQVGFVRLCETPTLRMAGGEFCGNAAMSAAALWRMQNAPDGGNAVSLSVSGVDQPVEVRLAPTSEAGFDVCVRMPRALGIAEREFAFSGRRGALPLVSLRGISHIVIGQDAPFFDLLRDRSAAEQAVKTWCLALRAEGLGLMFLERDETCARLTPLVYVPGSGTVFWETACASGSSAVGMAMAEKTGGRVELVLRQPGGTLRVESDPGGETLLYGSTKRIGQYTL